MGVGGCVLVVLAAASTHSSSACALPVWIPPVLAAWTWCCAGQTGSELSADIDQRAFSFFNSMLDVVMEAHSTPATPNHGKSLGAELYKAVEEAFAFMRIEFSENGNGEHAVGGQGASRDRIMEAAREHIHADDVQPCSVFRRAVFWHWANLEYGCSADLGQVHLPPVSLLSVVVGLLRTSLQYADPDLPWVDWLCRYVRDNRKVEKGCVDVHSEQMHLLQADNPNFAPVS